MCYVWDLHQILNCIILGRFLASSEKLNWSNVLTERFSIPYKNQTEEDTSF